MKATAQDWESTDTHTHTKSGQATIILLYVVHLMDIPHSVSEDLEISEGTFVCNFPKM
jgi:hypothetical protein